MVQRIIHQPVFLFVFISQFILTALSGNVAAQEAPDTFLTEISQNVLQAVQQHQDTYADNPDILQDELFILLDPIVDFEGFARGVMGSYYAQATPAQQTQFTTAFKSTLVKLYTSALVASKVQNITVEETIMSPPNGARVLMKVSPLNNDPYTLQYNMRKNDAGKWMVRNIILDGVNIGLTYRNQFKSAMETENQDLERVITLWPQLIDNQ